MYPKILFPLFDQRIVLYFFIKRDDPKRTGRPFLVVKFVEELNCIFENSKIVKKDRWSQS